MAAGFEISLHETERPGHAAEIIGGEAVESAHAVVAVGGDGTAFEVLQVGSLKLNQLPTLLQPMSGMCTHLSIIDHQVHKAAG